MDPERAAKFREVAEQFGFDPARDIIPHGSYLINLGSTDPVVSNMHCCTDPVVSTMHSSTDSVVSNMCWLSPYTTPAARTLLDGRMATFSLLPPAAVFTGVDTAGTFHLSFRCMVRATMPLWRSSSAVKLWASQPTTGTQVSLFPETACCAHFA